MSRYPDDAPLSPEEEEVMRKVLARGLAKYRGIASPEFLALMNEVGEEGLRTHPLMRTLVRRIAAQKAPLVSGEVPKGGRGSDESGKEGAS